MQIFCFEHFKYENDQVNRHLTVPQWEEDHGKVKDQKTKKLLHCVIEDM